jgi:hypothetical protein
MSGFRRQGFSHQSLPRNKVNSVGGLSLAPHGVVIRSPAPFIHARHRGLPIQVTASASLVNPAICCFWPVGKFATTCHSFSTLSTASNLMAVAGNGAFDILGTYSQLGQSLIDVLSTAPNHLACLVGITECGLDGFLPEIVRRGVIFLEASREFRNCGD